MLKKICGLTLIELLVSMILMSLVVLGLSSIDTFSRHHVISSDKRVKVQNEVSYTLEYMSKYVQQSIGDISNPPIRVYSPTGTPTGFQVRVVSGTPTDLSDYTSANYTWVTFSLSGNEITCGSESLIKKISGSFVADTLMPDNPPDGEGFYVKITGGPSADQGMAVDVGLVGRYDPAVAASLNNPQISMKTHLVSLNSPAQ